MKAESKCKTKTVYGIRTRIDDAANWSEPSYYKSKARRDMVGSISRIICGIRTHSFEEKKTLEEIEELCEL